LRFGPGQPVPVNKVRGVRRDPEIACGAEQIEGHISEGGADTAGAHISIDAAQEGPHLQRRRQTVLDRFEFSHVDEARESLTFDHFPVDALKLKKEVLILAFEW